MLFGLFKRQHYAVFSRKSYFSCRLSLTLIQKSAEEQNKQKKRTEQTKKKNRTEQKKKKEAVVTRDLPYLGSVRACVSLTIISLSYLVAIPYAIHDLIILSLSFPPLFLIASLFPSKVLCFTFPLASRFR